MAEIEQHPRYTLKDSVYVAIEPLTGGYIDIRKAGPRLARLPFATLCFTLDPIARRASERLAGVQRLIALLLFLFLTACATPGEWVDMPHYRPKSIDIIERADLNMACGQGPEWNGQGCALRYPDHAVVYLRPDLNDGAYQRVMTHEMVFHIIQGKNHDRTPNYRLEGDER